MVDTAVVPRRTPLRDLESVETTSDERPMLAGRALVPAHDCWYPPAVEVEDLLRVNFDRRDVGPDGLYLVEITGARGVEWRGCRRFERLLSGRLRIDERGTGLWKEIESLDAHNLRVVGYVEQVYKPARSASALWN